MLKQIQFDPHEKIKAGVDKLANVVKSTLGPGGTNVILERGHLQHITKDGVSVAREVFLKDPIENIGAQIIKGAAQKTVTEAGDGTTTATVLAQAIFHEGLKRANTKGLKMIEVKREIDRSVVEVVEVIRKMSKKIKPADIHKISTISANGDEEIGKLVGDAIEAVGLEGMVTVEESKSLETYLKKVDGMRWDRGYMSTYFINKPEKAVCEFDNPLVLIYDGNLNSVKEMMTPPKYNIIERYRSTEGYAGRPLIIIANDFGAEFVTTMAVNVQNKAIECVLVQAPDFGDTRKSILYDIAAATGAKVIGKESGITWKEAKPEHFGQAESVRVTQWTTTIVGGHGGLLLGARVNELREQMKETNEHALEVLKTRLARLVNGLMVIYVGGASDLEVQEKRDRIDDALNATRAAIEEGVLPGGGVAYLRAMAMGYDSDGDVGMEILKEALKMPFLTIAENVGKDGKSLMKTILANENVEYGYNARTLQFENLVSSGVIDPAKVVRLALENAASVAGMLLTTKAVIHAER